LGQRAKGKRKRVTEGFESFLVLGVVPRAEGKRRIDYHRPYGKTVKGWLSHGD